VPALPDAGAAPAHARFATEQLLEELDEVGTHIGQFEDRMRQVFKARPALQLLMTLPGVGFILGMVILLEVGDVHRFPNAEHLTGYAGTTPRVDASGGEIRFGRLRPDVNHYLKWAYFEAANVICMHQQDWPKRHVVRLYQRVAHHRGHPKALAAVARHLAEVTSWI